MRDELEFEQYVVARWATLHRLALLLTGAEAGAQDLVQLTLEKTYVAWPRIASMESPDGYVRRIMLNTLASSSRRAWRRHEVTMSEPPDREVEEAERVVLDRALLWPLVCALPQRQRAVIVLRYYEDLTEREIADVLGCAVGTVKSHAHDAMVALRRGVSALPTTEGADR